MADDRHPEGRTTRARRRRGAIAALAVGAVALGAGVPPLSAVPAPAGTGLVAWWRAEGSAADVTGAHNGVLEGATATAAGRAGLGFALPGSGAVVVPDSAALYPGPGPFTVDAWFKTTVAGFSQRQTIVAHAECANACGASSTAEFAIRIAADGHLTGVLHDAGDTANPAQVLVSPGTVTPDAWHHTALTRDVAAGTATLYLDGAAVTAAPLAAGATGTIADDDAEADQMMIGATREVTSGVGVAPRRDFLTGSVDEVSYWSRALSAGEVSAIAVAGAEGKTIDSTPPSSQALAPVFSPSAVFTVPYVAVDDNVVIAPVAASGLARVELWARAPGEPSFRPVAVKTSGALSNGGFVYSATAGNGTYEFYTVATDLNGNVEAAPGVRDTATTVTVAPVAPAPPATAPATPATPALVVGPPRSFDVGRSRIRAPRRLSLRGMIPGRCVNVAVTARAPLTVTVTIYSGRRSLRLFGTRTARFTAPARRVVCVPIPRRARSFTPRDGLTLDIRSADVSRVSLKVGRVVTRRTPIALVATSPGSSR